MVFKEMNNRAASIMNTKSKSILKKGTRFRKAYGFSAIYCK